MNDSLLPVLPSLTLEPELRERLLDGFAMSSADWSQRAAEAMRRGDPVAARTFALVARVADSVAKGGVSWGT